MIFLVNDLINSTRTFFVADLATQAQGEALGLSNATFTVGTRADATALLTQAQTDFLNSRAELIQVVEEIVHDNGDVTWTPVSDINTAPEGRFKIYNGVDAQPASASSKTEAQTQIQLAQARQLSWAGLVDVIELENLPTAPKV